MASIDDHHPQLGLIAQAMAEDMLLLTADQMVGRYKGPIMLVQ